MAYFYARSHHSFCANKWIPTSFPLKKIWSSLSLWLGPYGSPLYLLHTSHTSYLLVLEGGACCFLCLEHSAPPEMVVVQPVTSLRSLLKYFSFSVKISLSIVCKLPPHIFHPFTCLIFLLSIYITWRITYLLILCIIYLTITPTTHTLIQDHWDRGVVCFVLCCFPEQSLAYDVCFGTW